MDWLSLFDYAPFVAIVIFLAYTIYTKFIPAGLTARDGSNKPLLNSFYTQGMRLAPLHKDKFGSLSYVLYTTAAPYGKKAEETAVYDETIICCVTLPFKSDCHLIGITKNGSLTFELRNFIAERGLEQIVLEGDFPRYAYLYSPPGNQVNARYLMDPSAMAYVADFCKTHHWEIVGNYLYFVSSNSIKGKKVAEDPTPIMTQDVERFVDEIKPALISG